jgi:DNA-3-methyladenine glycosylase I
MKRCDWIGKDPQMLAYHDEEWGLPQFDGRAMWESLMLSGFQAGLSWLTILHKREAFRRAFSGFQPAAIAHFGEKETARLMADPSIIRSRSKIGATIAGAQIYQDMLERGEGLSALVWGFVDVTPIQNGTPMPTQTPLSVKISGALRARGFKFIGPVIVYAWMQSIGMVNDHSPECFRRRAVQHDTRAHHAAAPAKELSTSARSILVSN